MGSGLVDEGTARLALRLPSLCGCLAGSAIAHGHAPCFAPAYPKRHWYGHVDGTESGRPSRRGNPAGRRSSELRFGSPGKSSAPSTGPTTSTQVAGSGTGPSTTGPCSARSVIEHWPIARRAAAVIVAPVLNFDMATVAAATGAGAGGLLLLGGASPPPSLGSQLRSTISAERPSFPPLVMADQEGGGVQRLAPAVTPIPWPRDMADTMTADQIQQLATTLGRQMRALGVNVDLAPVLDVDAGTARASPTPTGRDRSAPFRRWRPEMASRSCGACRPAG